jgi:predicted patatin/cPLA2 family phospholipase
MRSIYSAGGAVALAQLGFSELFDEVYATSAGVMNAAYFLTNQPLLGITIYYESCTTALFMNPMRLWKILDIDYLFDQVIKVDKPLDVDNIISSPTRFFVAVIDKATGDGFLVDTRKTATPLLDVLKAATAMPVLYNRSVSVDGRFCIDGGLAIPFPLRQALARGCTDVLVLLTRSADYRSKGPTRMSRRMFDLICARGSAGLNRTFAEHHEPANEYRDLAFGRSPAPKGANIATLCTEEPETITRTTSNRVTLRDAAVDYARKTLRIFGEDADSWDLPPL